MESLSDRRATKREYVFRFADRCVIERRQIPTVRDVQVAVRGDTHVLAQALSDYRDLPRPPGAELTDAIARCFAVFDIAIEEWNSRFEEVRTWTHNRSDETSRQAAYDLWRLANCILVAAHVPIGMYARLPTPLRDPVYHMAREAQGAVPATGLLLRESLGVPDDVPRDIQELRTRLDVAASEAVAVEHDERDTFGDRAFRVLASLNDLAREVRAAGETLVLRTPHDQLDVTTFVEAVSLRQKDGSDRQVQTGGEILSMEAAASIVKLSVGALRQRMYRAKQSGWQPFYVEDGPGGRRFYWCTSSDLERWASTWTGRRAPRTRRPKE